MSFFLRLSELLFCFILLATLSIPLIIIAIFIKIESKGPVLHWSKRIGIENKHFAGHSLRSGFATVAAESGADERSIMAMTGHKTTQMVRRYIREANIFKNNALNKIKV